MDKEKKIPYKFLTNTTNTSSFLIGKPSKSFFNMALYALGVAPKNTCMVGDDLYNDIEPANELGLLSILVKTGKYRKYLVEKSNVLPDLNIDSIADLPSILSPYIK